MVGETSTDPPTRWQQFKSRFKSEETGANKNKIGVFAATAIAGNDITSSVFYVAGAIQGEGGRGKRKSEREKEREGRE